MVNQFHESTLYSVQCSLVYSQLGEKNSENNEILPNF
jgi:hypothetical protein